MNGTKRLDKIDPIGFPLVAVLSMMSSPRWDDALSLEVGHDIGHTLNNIYALLKLGFQLSQSTITLQGALLLLSLVVSNSYDSHAGCSCATVTQ